MYYLKEKENINNGDGQSRLKKYCRLEERKVKKLFWFRKLVWFIVLIMLVSMPLEVMADTSEVVTFGADLSQEQKESLAKEMGIDLGNTAVPIVEVTNAEERSYLKGLVPDNVIGTRAISSALIQILPEGSGVSVTSKNITWVTSDMYANALVTAKVKDAKIMAIAPFPVSGTAALTGIIKGFERATGVKIDEEAKRTANEELVRTGELGQEIGKEKATELILKVKERVIADKITDPQEIKQIIINVAGDLNINLTAEQINQLVQLMEKINKLDLNIRDISSQLQDLKTKIDDVVAQNEEVKSLLQRILDALNRFIEQVRSWFDI